MFEAVESDRPSATAQSGERQSEPRAEAATATLDGAKANSEHRDNGGAADCVVFSR